MGQGNISSCRSTVDTASISSPVWVLLLLFSSTSITVKPSHSLITPVYTVSTPLTAGREIYHGLMARVVAMSTIVITISVHLWHVLIVPLLMAIVCFIRVINTSLLLIPWKRPEVWLLSSCYERSSCCSHRSGSGPRSYENRTSDIVPIYLVGCSTRLKSLVVDSLEAGPPCQWLSYTWLNVSHCSYYQMSAFMGSIQISMDVPYDAKQLQYKDIWASWLGF